MDYLYVGRGVKVSTLLSFGALLVDTIELLFPEDGVDRVVKYSRPYLSTGNRMV